MTRQALRIDTSHLLPFCALLLFLLSGLFPPIAVAMEDLDRIVAVVNNDVIMESELQAGMERIREQLHKSDTRIPPTEILERQVLERLIMNKILLQRAARAGVRVDDNRLNQAIGRIAKENKLSISQFRKILENEHMSFNHFREQIRDEMTISLLQQREVDNRVIVTDREIKDYLDTEQSQAGNKIEYHLRHILIATPEGASPEQLEKTRTRAKEILRRLHDGEDFSEMAVSISDGQQALEGGDLGWRSTDRLPTLFAKIVPDMKKGDISDLLQSGSGFHIIKLTGKRSGEKVMVPQTHARHILIRPSELVSEADAKTRLAQLKLRLEGGDDFAELARSNSDDRASALKGGDLGWTSPGELVPEFEQAMDKLKPGEISDPFKTQYGWHIVQVLGRRQHDSTDTVKRNKVRQAIRQRKIEEARQDWTRRLRDEAYVEYRLGDE